MNLQQLFDPFWRHWGDIASALGVIVSSFGLSYAIKAERAAKQAARAAQSANEAANAARAEGRRRSLSDDLQAAVTQGQQVGVFLAQRKWEAAFLRAQDVAGACGIIVSRWERELAAHSDTSRDNLTRAGAHYAKISEVAMRAVGVPPVEDQIIALASAHRRAFQLLNEELGSSLRKQE